jgi:hypothetical protein
MLHRVLNFLSAYYPRYLCRSCLATLMEESQAEVLAALVPTAGLEFANADCIHCNVPTAAVRFIGH